MNASEIFVGRQPIVDRGQKLIGFELLFRAGHTSSAVIADDTQATASVIANSLGELGLNKVLDGHRAYINFSTQMLMTDLVDILPPDRVILEILGRLLERHMKIEDAYGRLNRFRNQETED